MNCHTRIIPWLLTLLLAVAAFAAAPARAQEKPFGVTGEWVRDDAHVLKPDEVQRLIAISRDLQEKAGFQLFVLTVPTLNGEDPNHAATRYGNEIRAGRAQADTGVVMLLAMQDRQFYIATGKGTEATLPDNLTSAIWRDTVRPYLKQGQPGNGLIAGAVRIASILQGSEDATPWPSNDARGRAPTGEPSRGSPLVILLVIGAIVALVMNATRGAKKCPRCGRVMDVKEHIVKPATMWRDGYGFRERHCPHCGYSDRQRIRIPRRGGGFYGGGPFIGGGFGGFGSGGGWGGGSSSGGGGFSGGGGGFGGGGSFGGGGAGGGW